MGFRKLTELRTDCKYARSNEYRYFILRVCVFVPMSYIVNILYPLLSNFRNSCYYIYIKKHILVYSIQCYNIFLLHAVAGLQVCR